MLKNITLIFSIVLLFFTNTVSAGDLSSCRVVCKHNELSIYAHQVFMRSLLDRLHQRSGININWLQEVKPRKVSIKIEKLPIEGALKRILCHFNYALVEGVDLQHTKVIIYGEKSPTELAAQQVVEDGQRTMQNDVFESLDASMQITHEPAVMEILPPGKATMKIVQSHNEMKIDFTPRVAPIPIEIHPQAMDVILP